MRIISYNILNGGRDRVDLITGILKDQKPDVVVLVEADDADVVEQLADLLKMSHVHGPSGGDHAGAILSRWPITRTVNHAIGPGHWMNAFLEAGIRDPITGEEWSIVALHFAAHASEEREQLREAQLDSLFDCLLHLREKPHLLAGDFNSNAPSQKINPAKCSPRTRRDWTENGGSLPRRIVQRLLNSGYLDTLHEAAPEVAEVTGTYTTRFPGQRIDYIFTHGVDRSRIRSAWIEQGSIAEEASDHFFIGADID